MQSCLDLARSTEHQVYRTLSNCASRRGIINNGVTEVCRITGLNQREAAEAVETLIDGDLIEPLGEGSYQLFQLCKCPLETLSETTPKSPPGTRSIVRSTHFATERQEVPLAVSQPSPLRLSRSLPKNRGEQDWREMSPQGQLFYLASQRFRDLCGERAISPRGFNRQALYANLKRWHDQGTSVEVIEEMMRCFVAGTPPHDFERGGTIAWKLFTSRRASLEQKAKDRLVWQHPEPTGTLEKYRAERARYDERQRQLALS